MWENSSPGQKLFERFRFLCRSVIAEAAVKIKASEEGSGTATALTAAWPNWIVGVPEKSAKSLVNGTEGWLNVNVVSSPKPPRFVGDNVPIWNSYTSSLST